MGNSTNLSIQKHIFRVVFMVAAVILIVIPVIDAINPKNVECNYCVLDDGWDVTVRGEKHPNVKLSNFSFDLCNMGDRLELSTVIPKSAGGIVNPILNYYSVHSVVDVYLDDKKIYSFGHEEYEKGKIIGYGNHFIDMPDDYVGKTLKVQLIVTENSAFGGIPEVYLEDGSTYAIRTLSERRYNLLVSCFLILFGIILMIISILMLRKNANFGQTYCIAMFSFVIGCWALCNGDLIEFFSTNMTTKVYLEYMSIYIVPIPLIFYFKDKVYDKKTPFFFRLVFWAIVGVDIAFAATAYLSQIFNIAHFPAFLPYAHIILIISMVFVMAISIADMRYKRKRKIHEINSIMMGLGLASAMLLAELLRFNLSKYFIGFEGNSYRSATCFAVLIVVISLLVDYGQSISNVFYRNVQQNILEKMAYVDELTDLANRRKCEDSMDEYKEQNIPYAVISFDLNFLKKINDSEGHEMGDEMLRDFADLLKGVFGEFGVVGRMGGDEFMALLANKTTADAEQLMEVLKMELRKHNQKKNSIFLSTSFGIADSSEVDVNDDAHAAYRLADARMYVNKRATNHGRG